MTHVLHVDMDIDDYMAMSVFHGVWACVAAKCIQMSVNADLGFSGARACHLAEWNIPGAFARTSSAPTVDGLEGAKSLGQRLAESLEQKQRAFISGDWGAHLAELWTFFTAVHPVFSLLLYSSTARPWRMQVVAHLDATFGALMLAALVVNGDGAPDAQDCAAGVVQSRAAQDIGTALATSILAAFPVTLVLALDGRAVPPRTQGWTFGTSNLLVPILGFVYFAACILALCLFLANACSAEADRWLLILVTQLVLNWLLLPSALTLTWSAVIRVLARRPELLSCALRELRCVLGGEFRLRGETHERSVDDLPRGSARTCWDLPGEVQGLQDQTTAPEVAFSLRGAASPAAKIKQDSVVVPAEEPQSGDLIVEDVAV